jgi:fido (protein-threonine AMPylation protein)
MRDFNPKFYTTNDLNECANQINLPHEDYPILVDVTKEIIELGIKNNKTELTLNDILAFHSLLFREYNPKHILIGKFRLVEVTVAENKTPHPWKLPELMFQIMPVNVNSNLKDWYKNFQLIHPFHDGNGRIGGIVIAILSFLKEGKFLVPREEKLK